MHIPFLDLKQRTRKGRNAILKRIQRIVDIPSFILGKEVETFEERFALYCQTKYAIGMSSGSAALHAALLACGVGPGDEVITVPNTFFATAEAISLTGARPCFVDISPDTYTMDIDQLRRYLSARRKRKSSVYRVKAIVAVHMYGHPVDMTQILEISREYKLKVIEDASHAHGAEWKGKKAGSFGDAGCFSFYPTKILGAWGDAGIVTTNTLQTAQRLRSIREHGRTASSRYYHTMLGLNARLDDVQAAVLNVHLAYIDTWIAKRRSHAAYYHKKLSGTGVITPCESAGAKAVYYLYVIRIPGVRAHVMRALDKARIGSAVHYPLPLHLQKVYKPLGYQRGAFPVAEDVARQIISLPLYPELTRAQIDYICEIIKEVPVL